MDNIQFKRLEQEDFDLMQKIIENDNMIFNKDSLNNFIQNELNYAFIGIQNNQVVALLYGYGMERPDGRKMFYIHSVDVLKEYQETGIGTKLMQFTLEYIKKENKYYKFFVLKDEDNVKACKLYSKYAEQKEQILFESKI